MFATYVHGLRNVTSNADGFVIILFSSTGGGRACEVGTVRVLGVPSLFPLLGSWALRPEGGDWLGPDFCPRFASRSA